MPHRYYEVHDPQGKPVFSVRDGDLNGGTGVYIRISDPAGHLEAKDALQLGRFLIRGVCDPEIRILELYGVVQAIEKQIEALDTWQDSARPDDDNRLYETIARVLREQKRTIETVIEDLNRGFRDGEF